MKINTNRWNRVRYTIYVPVYDIVGNLFSRSRKRSIEQLEIKADDKVLLIGAGTGLDIAFLTEHAEITATDITPAMVHQIKKKHGDKVNAMVMDGHNLAFADQQFDKIILHLILAVIPDPLKCIKETERVLKPNGKVAVFDKFLDPDQEPSLIRRFFNFFSRFLFTDINRKLEEIIKPTSLKLIHKEKAQFGGVFKIYILEKPNE